MNIPAAKIYFPEEDRKWILEKMDEALASGWLTLGNFNREFETEFARRHGVEHAVAVNSGTSSIEIILRAVGVAGKEVVVPTNTFFATAAAVVHAGGRPRFADIDPATFALSLDALKKSVNKETAAVVIVHIGGLITPEINKIRQFCDEKGLKLVEDAAHAHGASYEGNFAGSFGVAGSFSFYPTKVITSGEGGMIVTADEELMKEAQVYRDQGKAGFYGNFHVRMGYNWRLSELHAIVGVAQLRRLDEFIAARKKIAAIYDRELQGMAGITPVLMPAGVESCYYKYMALLGPGVDRSALKKQLREEFGVSLSGEVYETPLHRQPVFEQYASGESLPAAEDICERHICLPLYAEMTPAEANHVLESIERSIKA